MKNLLEYEDVLKSLVQKYNRGVWDEDMMQDAWVKATECYNDCLKKGITDDESVKSRIIAWVKNDFIDKARKKHVEIVPYSIESIILEYVDTTLLLVELRNSLSDKENEILTFLLQGRSVDEICELTKKSRAQVYKIMVNIKRKIKD